MIKINQIQVMFFLIIFSLGTASANDLPSGVVKTTSVGSESSLYNPFFLSFSLNYGLGNKLDLITYFRGKEIDRARNTTPIILEASKIYNQLLREARVSGKKVVLDLPLSGSIDRIKVSSVDIETSSTNVGMVADLRMRVKELEEMLEATRRELKLYKSFSQAEPLPTTLCSQTSQFTNSLDKQCITSVGETTVENEASLYDPFSLSFSLEKTETRNLAYGPGNELDLVTYFKGKEIDRDWHTIPVILETSRIYNQLLREARVSGKKVALDLPLSFRSIDRIKVSSVDIETSSNSVGTVSDLQMRVKELEEALESTNVELVSYKNLHQVDISPAPCSETNQFTNRLGEQCVTSKRVVFTRYQDPETLQMGWLDNGRDGKIWYDRIGGGITPMNHQQAIDYCREIKGQRLPSKKEFQNAENHGFKEIIQTIPTSEASFEHPPLLEVWKIKIGNITTTQNYSFWSETVLSTSEETGKLISTLNGGGGEGKRSSTFGLLHEDESLGSEIADGHVPYPTAAICISDSPY